MALMHTIKYEDFQDRQTAVREKNLQENKKCE